MGSMRRNAGDTCTVVLVGDCGVGKTALVSRFVNAKFPEVYKSTSFEKHTTVAAVEAVGSRVTFTIWDTTGSQSPSHYQPRQHACRSADAVLLCYKISDPTTLFSALEQWAPAVRAVAPDTPIVLVGCQSELRSERTGPAGAPVAADQALTFAQKAGASMYVETSAKISRQTVVAAFELAATVAAVSRTQHNSSSSILDSQLSTPSPKSKAIKKQRFSSSSASTEESPSPDSSLDRTTTSVEPTAIVKVWDPFQDAHSTKSSSLSSATSTAKSIASIPSITSSSMVSPCKTPKAARRGSCSAGSKAAAASSRRGDERMITIKCQRMTADKICEEIEVEVPAPIYDNIRTLNNSDADKSTSAAARAGRSKSLGSRLRSIFGGCGKS